MANSITNKKINDEEIRMSNGLTTVFFETICLAGSDIALENYQKDIIIWFSQSELFGGGCQGFDIAEIMWDKENFYDQQKFILKTINLAIKKTNWNRLHYSPNEEIFTTLIDFRRVIESFKVEFIETEKEILIFDFNGNINRYDQCNKHKIYKHCEGCVICNNEPYC